MILTHLLSLFIIVIVEHCDIQIVHFRNKKKSANAGDNSIPLKSENKSSNAYSSSHNSYFICFYTLRVVVFIGYC